jgi:hypothetical protein
VRGRSDFCLYTVDGGQRAVIFDRLQGVKDEVTGEGTHFLIPGLQVRVCGRDGGASGKHTSLSAHITSVFERWRVTC